MAVRNLFIEFLGLPSVGKTTLSHGVFEQLLQNNLPAYLIGKREDKSYKYCYQKLISLFILLKFILLSPRYTLSSSNHIVRSKQGSLKDFLTSMLSWVVSVSRLKWYSQKTGIYMTDHGIFQSLWTIGFSSKSFNPEKMIKKHNPLISSRHMIVIVEADLPMIEHRLKNKPKTQWRVLRKNKSTSDLLENAFNLMAKVKNAARQIEKINNNVHICVVDNNTDADYDRNVTEITDSIQKEMLTGEVKPEDANHFN
jgi:hypothetical protein